MQVEQSISVGDVFRIIAPIKWTLVLGALCGFVLGYGLSWLVQPVYTSTVTMLPTKSPESSNGAGGLSGQVGGLAALAGINIGGANENQVGAAEYLRSRTLITKFIDTHDLLHFFFRSRWDDNKHEWIPNWRGRIPTEARAIKFFKDNILRIAEDKKSGLFTVSCTWSDPALAFRWANDFVSLANDGLRKRAILDAQSTIDYLNAQLERTQTLEVKAALSRIIETQLKNLTLAQVREDYAFRVIDIAVQADKDDQASPKRPIYALVGMAFVASLFGWFKSRSLRRARKP